MIQKLQHVPDVLRVLDHEVQLHVELSPHELQCLNIRISIQTGDTQIIRKNPELVLLV